jgi:hypothetical protein
LLKEIGSLESFKRFFPQFCDVVTFFNICERRFREGRKFWGTINLLFLNQIYFAKMTISVFCFSLSIEFIFVPQIGVGFTLLVKIFFIYTRGQDDIETTVKLLEKVSSLFTTD